MWSPRWLSVKQNDTMRTKYPACLNPWEEKWQILWEMVQNMKQILLWLYGTSDPGGTEQLEQTHAEIKSAMQDLESLVTDK